MAANVAATRDRVRKLLTRLVGSVQVDAEEEFSFAYESTRVFIRVLAWEESAVVNVYAITNFEVPASPDLFRYVATESSWVFGSLSAQESEGSVTIIFGHTLLGDYLDPEALRTAIAAVAFSADQIDDEIKERFGGKRIIDLQ